MTSDPYWKPVSTALRRIGAADPTDPDALVVEILSSLMALLDADDGFLGTSLRFVEDPSDPLLGWRLVATHHPFITEAQQATIQRWVETERYVPDERVRGMVRDAGTVRALLHAESISPEAWATAPTRQLLEDLGVRDQIIGAVPLADDVEIYIGISRMADDRPFGVPERELLLEALLGLPPALARIAIGLGHVGTGLLTPREREVLGWLLRGLSEKEIAHELGLATRTTHHHVTSVYRKIGVRSRPELMALWIAPRVDRDS